MQINNYDKVKTLGQINMNVDASIAIGVSYSVLNK
jgi:hypothetical protein